MIVRGIDMKMILDEKRYEISYKAVPNMSNYDYMHEKSIALIMK